jgi:hypothetical protein
LPAVSAVPTARSSPGPGYDSNPNRDEPRKRQILPVISRKGAPNIKGLGELRYVVENARAHPGAAYTPVSVTEATGLFLLEWSMSTGFLTVTDGIDTFLVSDGLIHRQTSRFTVPEQ